MELYKHGNCQLFWTSSLMCPLISTHLILKDYQVTLQVSEDELQRSTYKLLMTCLDYNKNAVLTIIKIPSSPTNQI